MANNELVLLDQILAQRQADRGAPLPESYAFEIFACEQVLRPFDLSPEEVESGVVGGGNDGAIDGIYVFLGDTLITEDTEILDDDFSPSSVEQNPRLLLWLVQAKTTPSFTETAIDLVASSTSRLLDLTQSETDLLKLYSSDVVGKFGLTATFLPDWRRSTLAPKSDSPTSHAVRLPGSIRRC